MKDRTQIFKRGRLHVHTYMIIITRTIIMMIMINIIIIVKPTTKIIKE